MKKEVNKGQEEERVLHFRRGDNKPGKVQSWYKRRSRVHVKESEEDPQVGIGTRHNI